MGAKSSDDCLCDYKLKHDSEVIKKQADQRRDRMRVKQETAQTELVNIEERAKVILGTFAVPTWTYPAYLNFVREAWKKSKKFHDQTLAKETIGGTRGEIRDDHLLRSDVKARRGYAASDQPGHFRLQIVDCRLADEAAQRQPAVFPAGIRRLDPFLSLSLDPFLPRLLD